MGGLIGLGLWRLGVASLGGHVLFLATAAGAMAGFFNRLRLLRGIALGVLVLLLLVGYTPLAPALGHRIEPPPEALEQAPAVVVLGSFAFSDQTLSSSAQERARKAYLLLCRIRAPSGPYPPRRHFCTVGRKGRAPDGGAANSGTYRRRRTSERYA